LKTINTAPASARFQKMPHLIMLKRQPAAGREFSKFKKEKHERLILKVLLE